MMNLTKNKHLKVATYIPLISMLGLVLLMFSCNKDFPNTLRTDYPSDTTNIKEGKRKVLYIVLDGVKGSTMGALSPVNMTSILKNSVFTYYSLADRQTNTLTNAAGWANLTTGVYSDKHKVTSEDFAGNSLSSFPTIFTHLKEIEPAFKTASFAASNSFNDQLAADASFKTNFPGDDAKVKEAVVNELKKDDIGLVVGQFHSAEVEGASGGYTTANTNYVNAITTLDTYVGSMINAVKTRPNYAKEDWLVIIVSNKGGYVAPTAGSIDEGLFSDPTRNGFAIFYSPKLVRQELLKPDIQNIPYSGSAPSFFGNNATFNAAICGNTTTGDFGTTGDYTIMAKIRSDLPSNSNYPAFLGKTNEFKSGTPGWVFFQENEIWGFKVNGATQKLSSIKIRNGIWHSLAVRIYTLNGTRYFKIYTDGVAETQVAFSQNLTSPAPLTIGHVKAESDGTINMLIKEFAIYNTAIPEEALIPFMKKTEVLPTDTYYGNLIGYWPGNEGEGSVIKEKTGKSKDMTFVNQVKWTPFLDSSPNLSPPISAAAYEVVINSADVPTQIYQWLGIIPQSKWGLAGKVWRFEYQDVRN